MQCRRPGFSSWVGTFLWRRKWQPTPVVLPGKSHGWRSLAGYSPWGCTRVRYNSATKKQQQIVVIRMNSFGINSVGWDSKIKGVPSVLEVSQWEPFI